MSVYLPSVLSGEQASSAASTALNMAGSFLSTVTTKGSEYITSSQHIQRYIGQPNIDGSKQSGDLDKLFGSRVRPLLDIIDQIRPLLNDTPITLPQIVVVGDQSSGKTSVLEALSGIDLPRGSNITTRVPLILRLVKSDQTYATISASNYHNEEVLKDLSLISKRVVDITNKLAPGVSVSDTPISLAVYRPEAPDLTLVDLPGIIRNPMKGQSQSICQDIKNMIIKYISSEESIMLCVMPCSVDFATAECVALSKQFDGNGKRTIAVVTKTDLAENGIANKLRHAIESFGLETLGLIAVKNRNQSDNDNRIGWLQAREQESIFFENHNELKQFVSRHNNSHDINNLNNKILVGTSSLATVLTTIQEYHIKQMLPKKRIELRILLQQTKEQIDKLPHGVNTKSESRFEFDRLITLLCNIISDLCNGNYACINSLNLTDEQLKSIEHTLHINARVQDHIDTFISQLNSISSDYLTEKFAQQVYREIKENVGISLPNFLPHTVFRSLAISQLSQLRKPIQLLIDNIRSVHSNMIAYICKPLCSTYPKLSDAISHDLLHYIDDQYKIIDSRAKELLHMEEDVYTANAYYMDTVNKITYELQRQTGNKNDSSSHNYNNNNNRSTQQNSSTSCNHGLIASMLGSSGSGSNNPTTNITSSSKPSIIHVNDMRIPYNPHDYTLRDTSNLLNPNSVIEMQIACLAYTSIVHKRLTDNLSLLMRYYFTRSMSNGNNTRNPLHPYLQKQWKTISDSELFEYLKESGDSRQLRIALVQKYEKLEQANKLFDSLNS